MEEGNYPNIIIAAVVLVGPLLVLLEGLVNGVLEFLRDSQLLVHSLSPPIVLLNKVELVASH